jgi:5'(3')-deoxyribonucleotidase
MNRIFVDMDGVVVDFEGYMTEYNLTAYETKNKVGAYLNMKPIEGAIAAVRELIELGFDVWVATKPPTGVAHAYSEKAEWIFMGIPELSHKLIITHDKGLLGDEHDFLCDDRPDKANCGEFKGTVIHFTAKDHWESALKFFRGVAAKRNMSLKHEKVHP